MPVRLRMFASWRNAAGFYLENVGETASYTGTADGDATRWILSRREECVYLRSCKDNKILTIRESDGQAILTPLDPNNLA